VFLHWATDFCDVGTSSLQMSSLIGTASLEHLVEAGAISERHSWETATGDGSAGSATVEKELMAA